VRRQQRWRRLVPAQATAVPAAPAAANANGANARRERHTQTRRSGHHPPDQRLPCRWTRIFASGPTASAVYDFLLAWRKNPDGSYAVQPSLAKSWEPPQTRSFSICVTLSPSMTVRPSTLTFVVWNLNRMVQNPKSFAKNYLLAVDPSNPATAVDPMTVQVNLTRPSAAILSNLSDAGSNAVARRQLCRRRQPTTMARIGSSSIQWAPVRSALSASRQATNSR